MDAWQDSSWCAWGSPQPLHGFSLKGQDPLRDRRDITDVLSSPNIFYPFCNITNMYEPTVFVGQTWTSRCTPRNGTGLCRLLNIHNVPCSIYICVKVFITLWAMEVLSSLLLSSRGFIVHTDSSISTDMAGLRGPCGIHQPDTSIPITQGLASITNTFNHHPPQICGEVPAMLSNSSLPLEGTEVFKVDGLHAMLKSSRIIMTV